MVRKGESYVHYIPEASLSIQRNTSKVPNDEKFYVLYQGQIISAYRSRKKAEQKFYELLESSGYKPEILEANKSDPLQESVRNFMQSKSLFWTEGPIRGKKGQFNR